tara:strand:- start:5384 stop:6739 length:1356 start_codon:yes stop_codon:yes gene_type:complete
MKIINKTNQIGIVVFISTLSAMLPDESNYPLAFLPIILFIFLKVIDQNFSLKIIKPTKLFKFWIYFFLIYILLNFINLVIYGDNFNIIESISLGIIYIFYILYFLQFNIEELTDGIVRGIAPMFGFILFIEVPLRIFSITTLRDVRTVIGLRDVVLNTILGFSEEASHFPALLIILLPILIIKIKNFKGKYISIEKLLIYAFTFICLLHISGSYIISFIVPFLLFLLIKFFYYLIIKLKIKKTNWTLNLFILSSIIFFTYYSGYLISKLEYSVNLDHSLSIRLLSLFTGIFDFIQNPILGNGAGFYRFTRGESIFEMISFLSFNNNLSSFIFNLNFASLGQLISSPGRPSVPVYSSIGYFLSESGIFFVLLFLIPFFNFVVSGLKYAWGNFNSFKLSNLLYIIIGINPLSYLIYFSIGYPRALPYFIISQIYIYKFIKNDSFQNSILSKKI